MKNWMDRSSGNAWGGAGLGIAVLALCGGCASYAVRPPSIDSTELDYTSKTLHSLWWGLLEEPVLSVEPGVDVNDVRIVDNFAYDLLGVLTLGLWKPIEIQYRQRAPQGDGTEGTIGGTGSAPTSTESEHD